MRNLGFILACFWALGVLAGCGDATFSVKIGNEDAGEDGESEDAGTIGLVRDAGPSTDAADAAPFVCEPYSCKPGCGDCDKDAGLTCGTAGPFLCGSKQCSRDFSAFDGGFNCESNPSFPNRYECVGATTNDVMPDCAYQGTSFNTRWYCCKH